jgi:hypothetical protein
MAGLKLPKLPKTDAVQITVRMPAELHERLEAYARAYTETYGEAADVRHLIPHMLEAFLDSDKAFGRRQRVARQAARAPDRLASRPPSGDE